MAVNLYRSLASGAAAATLIGCAGPQINSDNGTAGWASPTNVERGASAVAAIDCHAFERHRVKWHARQNAASSTLPQLSPAADVENNAPADEDDELPEIPATLADVPLFSAAQPGLLPTGWQAWTVSRNKRPTQYSLKEYDQKLVVHALADSSASGLYVPLEGRDAGTLRWTWKTSGIISNADNSQGPREDAPLRIFAAFDGDTSKLPLKDQLLYEMARITTGREMPYATLMYIWGGKRPEGTVLPNPHTDRVRMIVVDSGSRHANQWRCHERDLRADYRKAFGKEPGRLVAIGIMTDTDNTKSRAESWYGDIALD